MHDQYSHTPKNQKHPLGFTLLMSHFEKKFLTIYSLVGRYVKITEVELQVRRNNQIK